MPLAYVSRFVTLAVAAFLLSAAAHDREMIPRYSAAARNQEDRRPRPKRIGLDLKLDPTGRDPRRWPRGL
jgi:hypothetical protein